MVKSAPRKNRTISTHNSNPKSTFNSIDNANLLNTCFTSLFEDRVDTYQRSIDSSNWYQLSRFNRFKDSDLLSVINLKSDSKKAVSIDDRSHFVVLSIEIEDPEQRLQAFNNLRNQLKEIGVSKPCCYQVNEFNHIHTYLCFNDMFDSKTFHPILMSWLKKSGLKDTVKIISTGMPIELPLQKDFAWINESLSVVVGRKDIATQPAIAMFLSDLNKGMLDLELFTLSIYPLEETVLEEDSYLEQDSSKVLDFSPGEEGGGNEVSESVSPQRQPGLDIKESENVVQFKKRPVIQPDAKVDNTEQENESQTSKESQQSDAIEYTDSGTLEVPQEDSRLNIEAPSNMLPPPGSTSFKQLSIPFSTSVVIPPNLGGQTPN